MNENYEVMMENEELDYDEVGTESRSRMSFLESVGALGLIGVAGYGMYRGAKWAKAKLKDRKTAKDKAPAEAQEIAQPVDPVEVKK